MASRRVLVVGSGGREHALIWRLGRDPDPPEVVAAPGNDGIGLDGRRLPEGELEIDRLVEACGREAVSLAVIGPEAPLALGLGDALAAAGITVFGPSREAARIESSKWFAKQVMMEAGIPTARAEAFQDLASARAGLAHFTPPYVVKADGLAAGKGVRVVQEREAAETFLAECLEGDRFGASGRRVLIEEHLEGEEASLVAVCDGTDFVMLPAARDYKRAYDHDLGSNTGGMGAYAPSERVDPALELEVGRRVVKPMLEALGRRGCPFRGALYCGLMLGEADVRVVEFNCRFGDPETEVVMPLLEGRFCDLLESAARGALDRGAVARRAGAAVGVALVDEGYPDRAAAGGTLEGLESLMDREDVLVFHAGSRLEEGRWRVRGGRAAHVVAVAEDRAAAHDRVYGALSGLRGEGWRYRGDIGGDPAPAGSGAGESAGRRSEGD